MTVVSDQENKHLLCCAKCNSECYTEHEVLTGVSS